MKLIRETPNRELAIAEKRGLMNRTKHAAAVQTVSYVFAVLMGFVFSSILF